MREEAGEDEDGEEQNVIASGMDEFMREMQNLSKIAKTSVREVKSVVSNVQSKNKLKDVVFQTMNSAPVDKMPPKSSPKKKAKEEAPVKPKTVNMGTNTPSTSTGERDAQTDISRRHMISIDERLGGTWWGAGGGIVESTDRSQREAALRLNNFGDITHPVNTPS